MCAYVFIELKGGIVVLSCFDECDESSLWFLSRLRQLMEVVEGSLRLLIITTQGTAKDEAVAAALARFPPNIVISVEHKPPRHLHMISTAKSRW